MDRLITHGSVFSGIGGAELAAEWSGIKNLFHCEINEFARSVLDYWYPNSESYGDITTTDFSKWRGKIDILSGGFPCQPFSTAGLRKGAGDDRYLWPQMLRVIGEVQPRYIVGENVIGLLTMVEYEGTAPRMEDQDNLFGLRRVEVRHGRYTLERICGELEAAGYSVQPIVIPACAINAPHRRDRVWLLAKRNSIAATEDADGDGRDGDKRQVRAQGGEQRDAGARVTERVLRAATEDARPMRPRGFEDFPTQPPLCRGDDGLPLGVADAPVYGDPQRGRRRWETEALKALGNAWVPQVAAEIFAAIVQDIRS